MSLYDGTVEGLEFPHLVAASVQFHPEAGPARTTPGRSSNAGSPAWSRADAGAHRPPLDLRDRVGADRDRAGLRVRLRRLPGAQGAEGGRLPDDRRQLQPRHDHDRPGVRRPHVHRAPGRRGCRGRAASRATRRDPADPRRSDGAQPRDLPRRGRRARRAGRRAARCPRRRDPARRGPRAVPRRRPGLRSGGAAIADRDDPRRARRDPGSRGRPARVHARWARRWLRRDDRRARAPRSRRGCARARSARCWSRSRFAAGTSSSWR